MGSIIGWLWAVILIAWSVKTAVDQNNRRKRQGSATAPKATPVVRERGLAEQPSAPVGRKRPLDPQFAGRAAKGAKEPQQEQAADESRGCMTPIRATVTADLALQHSDLDITALDGPSRHAAADTAESRPTAKAPSESETGAAQGLEHALGEPFNLRHAVLYSEILKPKFDE